MSKSNQNITALVRRILVNGELCPGTWKKLQKLRAGKRQSDLSPQDIAYLRRLDNALFLKRIRRI